MFVCSCSWPWPWWVGVPRNLHVAAVRNLGVVMSTQASAAKLPPPPVIGEMAEMPTRMDALQHTVDALAGCVAIIKVAAEGHTIMDVAIGGRFDELRNMMVGLSGNRGGMVAGQPGRCCPCLTSPPPVADPAGTHYE
jgi:hypothetical protein